MGFPTSFSYRRCSQRQVLSETYVGSGHRKSRTCRPAYCEGRRGLRYGVLSPSTRANEISWRRKPSFRVRSSPCAVRGTSVRLVYWPEGDHSVSPCRTRQMPGAEFVIFVTFGPDHRRMLRAADIQARQDGPLQYGCQPSRNIRRSGSAIRDRHAGQYR